MLAHKRISSAKSLGMLPPALPPLAAFVIFSGELLDCANPIGVTDSVFPGNPTASGSGMTGVFRWLILVASSEFAVP